MDAAVTRQIHHISAADGTRLHVTDFLLPMAQARGSVVLMHGLGEHSGRYQHLAKFFNACGFSVRAYDHRGHGRSGGRRGDVVNGDPIVQDAEIIVEDFSSHFDEPPFLFGHSMGGLFAARFALDRVAPLRGLILSSPALAVRLSRLEHTLLDVMLKVAPSIGVPNRLQPRFLSHDPDVVSAYKADPLVHNKISARLLNSMLSEIAYCAAHAGAMAVPTLMQVAGDDHLVDANGSRRFFAGLPAGVGTMREYPGLYHELFNETEAQRPFGDLKSWLENEKAR